MGKVILILDKFFLMYLPLQKKITLKKPSLIRVKAIETITIGCPHLDQFGSLDIHFCSDGCSTQFQFRFVFQQTMLFPSQINVICYYNERDFGKDAIDGTGGCIKLSKVVYRAVTAEIV